MKKRKTTKINKKREKVEEAARNVSRFLDLTSLFVSFFAATSFSVLSFTFKS